MSEFIRRAPLSSMADREPTHRFVLDAEGEPLPRSDEDLIRRDRELNAVLRKWRAYIYTQRIARAAWDKVVALMIAAGAIFLWALALAILVGMAAQ